jgi:hypothetical protein
MSDNIEIIKELLMADEKMILLFMELLQKQKNREFGGIKITHESGKINCIKSEKCLK